MIFLCFSRAKRELKYFNDIEAPKYLHAYYTVSAENANLIYKVLKKYKRFFFSACFDLKTIDRNKSITLSFDDFNHLDCLLEEYKNNYIFVEQIKCLSGKSGRILFDFIDNSNSEPYLCSYIRKDLLNDILESV